MREAIAVTLLLVSQLLLIQQVFKKFLPITDGWYLGVARAASNSLLYKEISFPFPLGTVFFEGVIPNLFSNPVVAEQYIHSFSWLVLSLAFYSIMRFVFSRYVSLLVSITVLTFYFTQPGNIISGYFELMYMFYFLGWAFLLWSTSKLFRYRRQLLLFGSLFLTSSVLIKQTALLPVVCSIIFYLQWAWKNERKSFMIIVATISTGLFGPFISFFFWPIRNGVFVEMLQNLAGGGKNPGGLNVIAILGSNILPSNLLLPTFFAVGLMIILCFDVETLRQKVLVLVTIWVLLLQFSGIAIQSGGSFTALNGYIFLFNSLFLVGLLRQLFFGKFTIETKAWCTHFAQASLLLALAFFPIAAFLMSFSNPQGSLSPNWSSWFIELGRSASSNFLICGIASLVFVYIAKGRRVIPTFFSVPKSQFDIFANFLMISTLTFYFMNSFAGGPGVETYALNIAVVLGVILQVVRFNFGRRVFVFCALGFFLPWNIGASAMQIQNPYSWYEFNELPLNTRRLSPEAPRLSSLSVKLRPMTTTCFTPELSLRNR